VRLTPSPVAQHRLSARVLAGLIALLLDALAAPVLADVTVTMMGFEFSPREVTIQAGEAVTWLNSDEMFRTTTNGSGSGDPEAGVLFDWSFFGGTGEMFTYAFETAGTYPYFCRFHEALNMLGAVTVMDQTSVPVGPASEFTAVMASPNPATGLTNVRFQLARVAEVRIDVYDLAGRRILELYRGVLPPGAHAIPWDGGDAQRFAVSSGVYVLRLEAAHGAATARVTLLR
jgi:plastocyanin